MCCPQKPLVQCHWYNCPEGRLSPYLKGCHLAPQPTQSCLCHKLCHHKKCFPGSNTEELYLKDQVKGCCHKLLKMFLIPLSALIWLLMSIWCSIMRTSECFSIYNKDKNLFSCGGWNSITHNEENQESWKLEKELIEKSNAHTATASSKSMCDTWSTDELKCEFIVFQETRRIAAWPEMQHTRHLQYLCKILCFTAAPAVYWITIQLMLKLIWIIHVENWHNISGTSPPNFVIIENGTGQNNCWYINMTEMTSASQSTFAHEKLTSGYWKLCQRLWASITKCHWVSTSLSQTEVLESQHPFSLLLSASISQRKPCRIRAFTSCDFWFQPLSFCANWIPCWVTFYQRLLLCALLSAEWKLGKTKWRQSLTSGIRKTNGTQTVIPCSYPCWNHIEGLSTILWEVMFCKIEVCACVCLCVCAACCVYVTLIGSSWPLGCACIHGHKEGQYCFNRHGRECKFQSLQHSGWAELKWKSLSGKVLATQKNAVAFTGKINHPNVIVCLKEFTVLCSFHFTNVDIGCSDVWLIL